MSKNRLRTTWQSMRQRYLNPNATGFHNYGGRGIGPTVLKL